MAFTQRERRPGQPANNAEYNSTGNISKTNPDTNDAINAAGNHERDAVKRQRLRNEDGPSAACDQCRSRKVRCDRQQPECSNCRKATVLCSWSSTSKRVNHTKQLRDEFSSVMDRLDEVQQTLNQLATMTRDIVARPNCHSNVDMSGACYGASHAVIDKSSTGATTATTTVSRPLLSRQNSKSDTRFILFGTNADLFDFSDNATHLSENTHLSGKKPRQDRGEERASGSPGSCALMQDIARQISTTVPFDNGKDEPGDFQDVGVRVALQHLRTSFPFEKPCPNPNIIDDSRPVSTPSRLMVDLFIDSFLCGFNTYFPIFDETELRCAVDAHYSTEAPVDYNPWALIFTNIVLLGLGREAQAASVSASHPKSMHHELTSSFIRNCDRAIANIDSFTRPSVVNIQALLTLALVGREFYGNAVFEKACQTACYLARIAGLHQSRNSRVNVQDPTKGDKDRLFRVLYSVDKFRTFLTGNPCDLYLFDSETQLDNGVEGESQSTRLNRAFDHMMRVWEEIYLSLYSARASFADVKSRAQRVSKMSDLVASWARRYDGLMESFDSDSNSELDPRRLELQYCHHITQVLILRCDRRLQFQKQVVDHARICLRVIAGVVNMPVTTISLAALVRMLQNYTVVAFTELLRFHLHNLSRVTADEMASEDVKLFRYIVRSIKAMQHPDSPQTYLSRLGVGLNWLLQVLETIAEYTREPLNASGNRARPMPAAYFDPSSSRPPSHPASDFAMEVESDSARPLRPNHGLSLAPSMSPSMEKEYKHPLCESELTPFGVSTPLTDPMSRATGQGSSSDNHLYLGGPQFDSFIIDGQNWDMGMEIWKDVFPS
ncbi:hypothetical protein F4680DRAFT_400126 [Xylaria scruposa]|nr:hypothetical protein F4680DRAFT_400126 [Xylaria scruposa]